MSDYDWTNPPTSPEERFAQRVAEEAYEQGLRDGGEGRSAEDGDTLTHEDIAQMSQDEINERWDEVAGVMEGSNDD